MGKHQGKIIAPSHLNIQEHEMNTARAIADYGMDVEFKSRIKGNRAKSADFVADGVLWEVKAPTSSNKRVIQKRIREAVHQSRDIIFDSRRMKHLSDEAIRSEVQKWAHSLPHVRRMIYVSRVGDVIRIK